MVGYDSQNNALTLSDDDSLKVGEYKLQYDSTSDEFQAEYEPTGDTKSIPRSTSGSLVPQGFADVLSQGEVLADNGEIYTSVQTAVDNSTGFVFIGPGTFNESVTISTQGLTLQGSGYDTLIDGQSIASAVQVSASNVTVKNLSFATDSGSSLNTVITATGADSCTFDRIHIKSAGNFGIYLTDGDEHIISNCIVTGPGNDAIRCSTSRTVVTNCVVQGPGDFNFTNGINIRGDDSIVSNSIVIDINNVGISIAKSDDIAVGNRITASGNNGLKIGSNSTDSIIANNRVSDSINSDINDQGTGTILDDNLTGPSN